jgi:hypothetical protein
MADQIGLRPIRQNGSWSKVDDTVYCSLIGITAQFSKPATLLALLLQRIRDSRVHFIPEASFLFHAVAGDTFLHKKKLHGLSPRANYTDRATAACRRS